MNANHERFARDRKAAWTAIRSGSLSPVAWLSLAAYTALAFFSITIQAAWVLGLGLLWLTIVVLRVGLWGLQMGLAQVARKPKPQVAQPNLKSATRTEPSPSGDFKKSA